MCRSARIHNLATLCVETVEVFPTYHTVTIFTVNQGHHTSDDQPAFPFGIETFSGLMDISVCVLMAVVRCVRKVAKKETISFAMSVCISALKNSAPSGWIFMKFEI